VPLYNRNFVSQLPTTMDWPMCCKECIKLGSSRYDLNGRNSTPALKTQQPLDERGEMCTKNISKYAKLS